MFADKSDPLDVASDLARTEATGTNVHLAGRAVNQYVNALNVGRPSTLGCMMRVADQIAGHYTLFADFAKFTHPITPPWRNLRPENRTPLF